ncbi:MAG: glycosyltransferase family 9 protein [Candidatus Omnitrophota bacterium]|nr:glycosyltransferase family 9 protein [Candidatus Omnitrophota bacterium]
MNNNFTKVIIINPFGIGDVLFSTPVIENVKIKYPDIFIGYLCNARTAPIFQDNPKVGRVFIYEKDEWRKLWKESKFKCVCKFLNFLSGIKKCKFDLAIDLSLGRHYSFFLWLLGIKKRYGFNYKNRGFFLTDKIDMEGYQGKHVIEYYLDLLHFMDISPVEIKPAVYIAEKYKRWAEDFLRECGISKGKNLIGIIPGGGVSWGKAVDIRRWSRDKFAKLADKIIDSGLAEIMIFGDASEKELCREVISLMSHKPIQVAGKTDLMQFAALLSKCGLVIANDGGPLHLSVAAGVKTVSLFGPVDENVYGQYPPNPQIHRIIKKDIHCRPCYRKFKMSPCRYNKKCLDDINVDEVFDAVLELLKKE